MPEDDDIHENSQHVYFWSYLKIHKIADQFNCVNLAWSMESWVWNSIPCLGFTSKNDINKHVWYSISSLVFNPNVRFESQVWY